MAENAATREQSLHFTVEAACPPRWFAFEEPYRAPVPFSLLFPQIHFSGQYRRTGAYSSQSIGKPARKPTLKRWLQSVSGSTS